MALELEFPVAPMMEWRGDGFFAGTAPASPEDLDGRFRKLNVPSIGRITVHESGSMTVIGETRSAVNGTWAIANLRRDRTYTLIGWDDTGVREAQIFTRQVPAPMP